MKKIGVMVILCIGICVGSSDVYARARSIGDEVNDVYENISSIEMNDKGCLNANKSLRIPMLAIGLACQRGEIHLNSDILNAECMANLSALSRDSIECIDIDNDSNEYAYVIEGFSSDVVSSRSAASSLSIVIDSIDFDVHKNSKFIKTTGYVRLIFRNVHVTARAGVKELFNLSPNTIIDFCDDVNHCRDKGLTVKLNGSANKANIFVLNQTEESIDTDSGQLLLDHLVKGVDIRFTAARVFEPIVLRRDKGRSHGAMTIDELSQEDHLIAMEKHMIEDNNNQLKLSEVDSNFDWNQNLDKVLFYNLLKRQTIVPWVDAHDPDERVHIIGEQSTDPGWYMRKPENDNRRLPLLGEFQCDNQDCQLQVQTMIIRDIVVDPDHNCEHGYEWSNRMQLCMQTDFDPNTTGDDDLSAGSDDDGKGMDTGVQGGSDDGGDFIDPIETFGTGDEDLLGGDDDPKVDGLEATYGLTNGGCQMMPQSNNMSILLMISMLFIGFSGQCRRWAF